MTKKIDPEVLLIKKVCFIKEADLFYWDSNGKV